MNLEEDRGILLSGNGVNDLNNEETLLRLRDGGLRLLMDQDSHFSVSENISTGYQWLVKPGCKGLLSVTESYDSPVLVLGENDIPIEGASGTKYISLTGLNQGNCTFSIAYARPWEFDWTTNLDRANKVIEFDIQVLPLNLG